MGIVTLDFQNLDLSCSEELCRLLENGEILYFPRSPLQLPDKDIDFLLAQRQVKSGYRKNIAYKPNRNTISGLAGRSPEISQRMFKVMSNFTASVTDLLQQLLSPYVPTWKIDYASFRPRQEQGRQVKFKARNDLLHIDSFPTRPTYGNRILRFFININPHQSRNWVTAKSFEYLLETYIGTPEMPLPSGHEVLFTKWKRQLCRWAKDFGFPVAAPSRYDEFMLCLHDYLKSNQTFQETEAQQKIEFPPNSSWMVFTDFVPHAALSGQFALEQTFLIDHNSMLQPEKAPLRLLEKTSGISLLS